MARRCGCPVGAALLALSLAVLLAAPAVPGAAGFHRGGDESGLVRGMLAAVRERAEAEDAARFAVAEHNRKQVRRGYRPSLARVRIIRSM